MRTLAYWTGKTGAGLALMTLAFVGFLFHFLDTGQTQTLWLAGFGLTTAGVVHKTVRRRRSPKDPQRSDP